MIRWNVLLVVVRGEFGIDIERKGQRTGQQLRFWVQDQAKPFEIPYDIRFWQANSGDDITMLN